jgi:hypothetical protein
MELTNLSTILSDVRYDDLTINVKDFPRKYKYVKYKKSNRTILVRIGDTWRGATYEVDVDRCDTAGECLDWIHQLHEKRWLDKEREQEFIDILFRVIDGKLWHWGGKR